jgi:hypothetical protein
MLIGESQGLIGEPESGEDYRSGSQAPGYDAMIATFQYSGKGYQQSVPSNCNPDVRRRATTLHAWVNGRPYGVHDGSLGQLP